MSQCEHSSYIISTPAGHALLAPLDLPDGAGGGLFRVLHHVHYLRLPARASARDREAETRGTHAALHTANGYAGPLHLQGE